MGDSSLKNHLHLSAGRGCYEGIFMEGRVKEKEGVVGSVEGAMCKSAVFSKNQTISEMVK